MSITPKAEIAQKQVGDTNVPAPITAPDNTEKFHLEVFGEPADLDQPFKQLAKSEREEAKIARNKLQALFEESPKSSKILPILRLDSAQQLPKDEHAIPVPEVDPHPKPINPMDVPVLNGGFKLDLDEAKTITSSQEHEELVKARAEAEQLRKELASLKEFAYKAEPASDGASKNNDLAELPKRLPKLEQTEAIPITTKEQFDKLVLHSDGAVVVDFNATWCGPCRAMKPNVDALAREYSGRASVYSVDVDAAAAAANGANWTQQYAQALPTISYFNDGKLSTPIVGGTSYATLKNQLENELGKASASVAQLPDARTRDPLRSNQPDRSEPVDRTECTGRIELADRHSRLDEALQLSDVQKTSTNPEGRYYIDDQNGGAHIAIDSPMAAAFLKRYASTHHCGGDGNSNSNSNSHAMGNDSGFGTSGCTTSGYDSNFYATRGRRHHSDKRNFYSSDQSHVCGRGCRH